VSALCVSFSSQCALGVWTAVYCGTEVLLNKGMIHLL
jgi:hypothetical protein